MIRNISRFSLLISIVLLTSCGLLQEKQSLNVIPHDLNRLSDSDHIKKVLYSQFAEWEGVRYQRGGLSRSGIDCSGFVYLTFKHRFGLHLPRTSLMQSTLGQEIKKDELKAGDLVFFKTGPTSNHVGIYLERNKFLHASQRKGITISRLDNVYWQSSYWKSIRM